MQEFFILKDSTNPSLEMELVEDGRYAFQNDILNTALQDSTVYFTMIDIETNIPKISKAKANVVLANTDSCEEKYVLQYQWKKRDVNKCGTYKAFFEINFNGNITSKDTEYPNGNLKVPIQEDLLIIVK